jgi:hypothetical protein
MGLNGLFLAEKKFFKNLRNAIYFGKVIFACDLFNDYFYRSTSGQASGVKGFLVLE